MSELQTGGGIIHWLRSRISGRVVQIGRTVRRFSLWGLLVPVVTAAWIITQVSHPWWKFSQPEFQEVISPGILGTGFVASAMFWVLRGEFFHRWMILVMACLLICKAQPEQAEPVVYIAAVILLWSAATNLGKMRQIAASRICVTLLGGSVLCYTAMATCVYGWWSFLPGHGIWKANLQLTLESLGHAMSVTAVLGTEVLWRMGRLGESHASDPATVKFPQVTETDHEPDRRAA